MAEIEEEENYRFPLGVTQDEEGDSVVRVCVVLPGLKKKTLSSEAANADVNVDFQRQSLDVKVALKSKSKGTATEKFRYQVKKLPHEVLPEKSTFKVKKDMVVISLYKKDPKSWAKELSAGGLETAIEPDPE